MDILIRNYILLSKLVLYTSLGTIKYIVVKILFKDGRKAIRH